MPFKSEAQRRYMHATNPKVAAEWEQETPKKAKLPEHVAKRAAASVVNALLSRKARRRKAKLAGE